MVRLPSDERLFPQVRCPSERSKVEENKNSCIDFYCVEAFFSVASELAVRAC